jgi:hypothetical protein
LELERFEHITIISPSEDIYTTNLFFVKVSLSYPPFIPSAKANGFSGGA